MDGRPLGSRKQSLPQLNTKKAEKQLGVKSSSRKVLRCPDKGHPTSIIDGVPLMPIHDPLQKNTPPGPQRNKHLPNPPFQVKDPSEVRELNRYLDSRLPPNVPTPDIDYACICRSYARFTAPTMFSPFEFTSFEDPTALEQVRVTFALPVSSVPLGVSIPVKVNLAAPQASIEDLKNIRVSLDLLCVIDVSSSMRDYRRLELVKRTLCFLSEVLSDTDRIAVVPFNHKSQQSFSLLPMTTENRELFTNYVQTLSPFGGTNIAEGIQVGLELLANRTDKNEHTCLFFLGDGADENPETVEVRVLEVLESFSYSLPDSANTFGIGYDHDHKLSQFIADKLKGQYFPVVQSSEIESALIDSVALLSTLRLRDICVEIVRQEDCGVDFEITRTDSGSTSFTVPSLSSHGHSDFTFEICINSRPLGTTIIRPVRIEITYTDAKTKKEFSDIVEPEIQLADEGAELSISEENWQGLSDIYKMQGATALKQLIRSADVNKLVEAGQIADITLSQLRGCIAAKQPKVIEMIQVLTTAKQNLGSTVSWNSIRPTLLKHCSAYFAGGRVYENPFVQEIREKAKTSIWLRNK